MTVQGSGHYCLVVLVGLVPWVHARNLSLEQENVRLSTVPLLS